MRKKLIIIIASFALICTMLVSGIYVNGAENLQGILSTRQIIDDSEYTSLDNPYRRISSSSNNPYIWNQWALKNYKYNGIDINIEKAWDITKGSEDVVVAVIDLGVDYNHEDLKDNIWTNKDEIPDNGIDDDNNGYIDDIHGWNYISDSNDVMDGHGHGTHVSGIIAAEDNDKGIIGAAPNVKIMPLKVGSNDGTIYLNSVEKAIEYGLSKGVKIFNCSFEGSEVSEREYEIIKNADALFLCAAGNKSLDNDMNSVLPANYNDLPNVISVMSIDEEGNKSDNSNYGKTKVDIAAPGTFIYSTVPDKYKYISGTSMATGYVSAVAALALSVDPTLTATELKALILDNARPLSSLTDLNTTGGMLDAGNVVEAVSKEKSEKLQNNELFNYEDIDVHYSGYINGKKTSSKTNGEIIGTVGKSTPLEAVKISLDPNIKDVSIEYRVYNKGIGWSSWITNNKIAGIKNKDKQAEAIEIRLTGKNANKYSVIYQGHIQNYGWIPWVKDGEQCGDINNDLRLEALKIKVIPKIPPDVIYESHIQNLGWIDPTKNGLISGTTGESLRLEAIKIKLENKSEYDNDLGIEYRVHSQNIGWGPWVRNDEIAGTTGQSLRGEAIEIRLIGKDADSYTIKYQGHIQDIGWGDWVSDGELCGTVGESRRLEAIKINISLK